MSEIGTSGLDVAKKCLAALGFNAGGKTVLETALKWGQVLPVFAKLTA